MRKFIVAGSLTAVIAGSFLGGYATHSQPASRPVASLTACPAPALPGQHAGYVTSGSRIVGTDGSNGLARGDVYTCRDGQGSVN